ncbi:hypothetical protein DES53_108213 [Roseimicrobium gellanilyticum]|uniref:Uncharacterized protein n=1 Tax=Roseimicrobium gellanilyticum TaxID=748857 RepID=A0A366HDL6_9BACT|nr:hypothetical protein DES53_108213 [Roseimicrobium gellanilyticum]
MRNVAIQSFHVPAKAVLRDKVARDAITQHIECLSSHETSDDKADRARTPLSPR